MKEYSTNKRYCPHLLATKVHSVEVYRQTKDVAYVCRRYHISKASLMRWNKKYDGTKESLQNKSHRPHSPHPRAHTEQELKWIRDYHKRVPNISICELYGKLRENKAYTRHPAHSIAFLFASVSKKRFRPRRRRTNTQVNTTRRKRSERNVRWM